jgi:tripartite-type tricarboxylate transporter receptor subunit TctC
MRAICRGPRIVFAFLALFILVAAACGPRRTGSPEGAGARGGAQSAEDFYRGKTVTIIVGYAPGGSFDGIARVLARHMGNHLHGQPAVIVENMDGAGSLVAANHLFNVAKPDGLTIGLFNEQQVLNQLTGAEGINFDARRFSWIGSAVKNRTLCSIRADSPYKTGDDFLRQDLPPLVLGGTAAGANTDDFPKLLVALFGMNLKLVSGYRGTAEIRLAVENRELDGLCWSWEALEAGASGWIETGFITIPLYSAAQPDADLEARDPNARRVEDLAGDEQTKSLIRAANAPGEMAKPFVAPPGTPADRLQVLRDAFKATVEDPAFQADTKQAKLAITPTFGEDTAHMVNQVLDLPPEQARRLAEIRR